MKVLCRALIVFLLLGILSAAFAADPNVFKRSSLSNWDRREASAALRIDKDAERAEVLAIDYFFESATYAWWRYWFRPSLDVTAFKGLSFWVKGDGSGRSLSPILSFWPGNVEIKYTAPAISLTFEGWRQFKVYFHEFTSSGRPPTDQELARLDNIMFNISGPSGEKGTIYMDGFEFFGKRSANEQSGMLVTDSEPSRIELLSDLETEDSWSGSSLTIVEDESRGKVGIWKLSTRGEQLRFRPANRDWSKYTGIGLWICSDEAADVQFELVLSADGPATGWDYYHTSVVVDWDGWQLLLVPFSALKESGTPLDFDQVEYLLLSTRGWGIKPSAGTLLIDKVFLYQDSSPQVQTVALPSMELPEIPKAQGGLIIDTFEDTRRWGDRQVTTGARTKPR